MNYEIPQQVPQGSYRAQDAENSRITEIADELERLCKVHETQLGVSQADVSSMDRTIRKTKLPEDGEGIMDVFTAAKAIMRQSGNMLQWGEGYPSLEVVQSDIEKDGSYVIVEEGRIVAYFAYLPSPEPTYSKIYGGKWMDDIKPYHVIHRIASMHDVHGIFKNIMDFCFSLESNIRIDTHKDNHIMQHCIEKFGFSYCGIILLASGDERLAYQRMI